MKMKSATLTVLAMSILATIMVTPIHAAINPTVYARADKASYVPGDGGTLIITVRNQGTQSFAVKNITVSYPWKAFITDHWDGNFTTVLSSPKALAAGEIYNTQYSFTVPTDGRATGFSTASISVGTDIDGGENFPASATITVAIPTYQPLSLTSSILPIISIILLAIAVAMLTLVYMGIGKLPKK